MNKREHLLACLIEEAAEIQQAATKALRFGTEDGYPGGNTTNAEDIAIECCDIIAVIEMLEECGIIEKSGTLQAINAKKARVSQFMEYAKTTGALTV